MITVTESTPTLDEKLELARDLLAAGWALKNVAVVVRMQKKDLDLHLWRGLGRRRDLT